MEKFLIFLGDHIWSVSIIFLVFVFMVIVAAVRTNKRKINNLKETQIPRRFQYLDTFYFVTHYDESNLYISFNVIQEKGNVKTYVLPTNSFKDCSLVGINNQRLVIGSGFAHRLPTVEFNSEGNFWIEKELDSGYSNNDNIITLHVDNGIFNKDFQVVYGPENNPGIIKKYPELEHLNKSYDLSLLEKSTFITGYAEFDQINEKMKG